MSEKLNDITATYVGAIEKFSECAKAFLQHVELLAQARSEYQIAAAASRELRRVLDTGDETLLTLMIQLEKAISSASEEPVLDKKRVELMPVKVEALKASGASAGSVVAKTFP